MRSLAACPICESRACRQVYTGRTTRNPRDPNRWSLFRCSTCDHGYLNPQPQWEELGGYYNTSYTPYQDTHGLVDLMESTIREARSAGQYRHVAIRPGLRVLDVGAGGGSFLVVAKALGAQVAGVEPSSIGVRACRENGLNVFEGTLEEYAKAGTRDSFDLITFSHVVEHLPDPVATLRVASTLLGAGGLIWLAVPNGACRSARRLQWRWHSSDLPIHLQHFSPQSMRVAATKSGLLLRSLRTYSHLPAVRSSIVSEWRQRWKVPRRVGGALLSQRAVERRAALMDRNNTGEAILAEFGRLGEASSVVAPPADSGSNSTGL